MPFGAFAPFPFRLGGTSTEGWTAAQFSRACADLVAARRSAPFCVLTINTAGTGTIERYTGQNGEDYSQIPANQTGRVAPALSKSGTGDIYLQWATGFTPTFYTDEKGRRYTMRPQVAIATADSSSALFCTVQNLDNTYIKIRDSAGTLTDARINVVVWADWGFAEEPPSIYDYGGSLNKTDNNTENPIPYAGQVYRDVVEQRGSAFSKTTNALTTVENIADARFYSCIAFRLPDQFRAAGSVTTSSGSSLEYYGKVYNVPRRAWEPDESYRNRIAAIARLSKGATYDELRTACINVLGSAFMALTLNGTDTLNTWSPNTFWPMNPGSGTYNIGGGDWYSDRCQILIDVQQPPTMSTVEFNRLVNVELYDTVTRILPAWIAPKWRLNGVGTAVWDGFLWDDGTLWDGAFDWG